MLYLYMLLYEENESDVTCHGCYVIYSVKVNTFHQQEGSTCLRFLCHPLPAGRVPVVCPLLVGRLVAATTWFEPSLGFMLK